VAIAPPLHVGFLLDASGSMDQDMKDVRTAAIKFLNQNEYAVDMTLVDFDTEVRRTVFSNDNYPHLIERIRMRKSGGMTAFYDALAVYLRGASTQDGQKVLVAYTDGGDTRSAITAGDVADLLKASDVTLYTLGYLGHQSSSYRSAAQMELQRFSQITGGQAFFPTSLKELDSLYEKILKEMNARYIIGYTSTDTRSDGAWRPVEIKLKRPDLKNAKVRTRPGYFAPLPAGSAAR
jgi:Ca-activated chloride channel family protein